VTIPFTNAIPEATSAMNSARSPSSSLQRFAPSPYGWLFAISIASPSESTVNSAATGPKTSSK
jgi:hypothetical protein